MRQTQRTRKPVTFLYHHRYWPGKDVRNIIPKLEKFHRSFRRGPFKNVHIIVFHQTLIDHDTGRKIEISRSGKHISVVEFRTHRVWGGKIDREFWALDDDDLIEQALRAVGADVASKAA